MIIFWDAITLQLRKAFYLEPQEEQPCQKDLEYAVKG